MATFRVPIMDASVKPDGSGDAFFEPYSVKATNDFFDYLVAVFNDTGAKDSIHGKFPVPGDYVGSPKFIVRWTSTATSGNFQIDVDYRSVAVGESLDQATAQEALTVTDVAPGTTDLMQEAELAATAGNFTANDLCQWILSRDGATEASGIAAAVTVHELLFEYADA